MIRSDRHRILYFLLPVLLSLLFSPIRSTGTEIPLDTLGDDRSKDEWAFWNQDLPLEAFPEPDLEGQTVELWLDTGEFKGAPVGVGWLAKRFYVPDSLVGRRFFLYLNQFGASELYFDGTYFGSLGHVAKDPKAEKRYGRNYLVPFQHVFDSSGIKLLLVHFSDHSWKEEAPLRKGFSYGVRGIKWAEWKNGRKENEAKSDGIQRNGTVKIIAACFFALGLVHLLIFLFYPRKRSNLFYAFLTWGLSIYLFFAAFSALSGNPAFRLYWSVHSIYFACFILLWLLTLLYETLKDRFTWFFWSLAGFLAIYIFLGMSGLFEGRVLFPFLATLVLFESFRLILIALLKKRKGAWIIAMGAGLFLIYPLYEYTMFWLFEDPTGFGFFSIQEKLWIASLPVSMSIFLARDFALTNKDLEKKLHEVEELSEKNLQQEREKQEILREKKEELEDKVEERTRELREQKEVVEEQKEQVEEAHEEITQSIDYAQKIQYALLHSEEYLSLSTPDHFILFKPQTQVSGDFYWIREHQGYLYFAAVDCTGHGVPGAFMSMLGISQLNEIMSTNEVLTPGYILTQLRKRVIRELSGTDPESAAKDGMDAAMVRIPLQNSNSKDELEVQFAGAQNPLYVIRKGIGEDPPSASMEYQGEKLEGDPVKPFKKTADGIEIKGDGQPVGYHEYAKGAFTTISLQLQKGDMLYFFSDGYADQFGGPKGKKFRYGPFKQMLANIHEKPLEEQKKELDKTFEDWRAESEQDQIDDVLVIGIRV